MAWGGCQMKLSLLGGRFFLARLRVSLPTVLLCPAIG